MSIDDRGAQQSRLCEPLEGRFHSGTRLEPVEGCQQEAGVHRTDEPLQEAQRLKCFWRERAQQGIQGCAEPFRFRTEGAQPRSELAQQATGRRDLQTPACDREQSRQPVERPGDGEVVGICGGDSRCLARLRGGRCCRGEERGRLLGWQCGHHDGAQVGHLRSGHGREHRAKTRVLATLDPPEQASAVFGRRIGWHLHEHGVSVEGSAIVTGRRPRGRPPHQGRRRRRFEAPEGGLCKGPASGPGQSGQDHTFATPEGRLNVVPEPTLGRSQVHARPGCALWRRVSLEPIGQGGRSA